LEQFSEKHLDLNFYISNKGDDMKHNDIEVGKYYSYSIWPEEPAVFFKCIGYDIEEGCFELQECPWYGYDYEENPEEVYPWLLYACREDDPNLEEIPEMRYIIRSIGLLIEKTLVEAVEEKVEESKKLPYQEPEDLDEYDYLK